MEYKNCKDFVADNFGYEYGLCMDSDVEEYCKNINNCEHKKLLKVMEKLRMIASLDKRGFKSLVNGVKIDYNLDDAIELAEIALKEIE